MGIHVLTNAITFIALMAVLIGVHELGHLMVARANGVFCESISLGMGKVIWERTDRHKTKWRLSILPIGGYVKMFGDADPSSVREQIPDGYTEEDMNAMSAFRKKPWQRILIALGGPLANFLLALVVLFGLNTFKGMPEPRNVITVASEESAAYRAGLRSGDRILEINGVKIGNFNDISKTLKSAKDLKIVSERKGERKEIAAKLGADGKLGVTADGLNYKKVGVGTAFCKALKSIFEIGTHNMLGILKIVKLENVDKVGGPISMFKMAGKQKSFCDFLSLLAFFSIMLGAINLLPIPILDGGSAMLSAIEWIIGHRLSDRVIEIISCCGLVAVTAIMLLGVWNDIKHQPLDSKIVFFTITAICAAINYLWDKFKKITG